MTEEMTVEEYRKAHGLGPRTDQEYAGPRRYERLAKAAQRRLRRSKYNNEIVETEGGTFHSRSESERWDELQLIEATGEITELDRQVAFEIIPTVRYDGTTYRKISYTVDFTYYEGDRFIAEEHKGAETKTYRLKLRLFLRQYVTCEDATVDEFRVTRA